MSLSLSPMEQAAVSAMSILRAHEALIVKHVPRAAALFARGDEVVLAAAKRAPEAVLGGLGSIAETFARYLDSIRDERARIFWKAAEDVRRARRGAHDINRVPTTLYSQAGPGGEGGGR